MMWAGVPQGNNVFVVSDLPHNQNTSYINHPALYDFPADFLKH